MSARATAKIAVMDTAQGATGKLLRTFMAAAIHNTIAGTTTPVRSTTEAHLSIVHFAVLIACNLLGFNEQMILSRCDNRVAE